MHLQLDLQSNLQKLVWYETFSFQNIIQEKSAPLNASTLNKV